MEGDDLRLVMVRIWGATQPRWMQVVAEEGGKSGGRSGDSRKTELESDARSRVVVPTVVKFENRL